MRAPAHYRSRLDHWRQWLDDHADAQPNHLAMARKLIALFEHMVRESEAAFDELHAVVPVALEPIDCAGPGCGRSFVPKNRRQKVCSPACRQALHTRRKRQPKAQVRAPIAMRGSGDRGPSNNVSRKPRSEAPENVGLVPA